MAFCLNCGAEIPEGAGFCGNCGAPVAAPKAEDVPEIPENEEVNAEPAPRRAYAPQAPQAYRAPRAPRAPRNAGPAPKNQKALKITSIVFAVAFLFFCIGLGGRIYTGRVVGKGVSEYNSEIEKQIKSSYGDTESAQKEIESRTINSKKKNVLIEAAAAAAHGDAKGMYSATLKAYRIGHPDYENDATYQSAVKVPPTKKQVENINTAIREATKDAHDKYGFNWTMLTLGSHYSFFMWFGGIVAALSLAYWILQGGRFNNFLQTTVWPALAVSFVLALTFIILDVALDANMNDLINNLIRNFRYYF